MSILRDVFELTKAPVARFTARCMIPWLIHDRQIAMLGFDPYSSPGKLRVMDEETKQKVIAGIDNELAYWGVADYKAYMKENPDALLQSPRP